MKYRGTEITETITKDTKHTNYTPLVNTAANISIPSLACSTVRFIAGNNRKKTEYIKASVDAGLNVLADKPMCTDEKGWELLKEAFKSAEQKGVLLYDIMTERYEITTVLQKALANNQAVFGELQPGTPDNPSVTKEF